MMMKIITVTKFEYFWMLLLTFKSQKNKRECMGLRTTFPQTIHSLFFTISICPNILNFSKVNNFSVVFHVIGFVL